MNQSLGLWSVCHCKVEYYYYTVSHTDGITLEYTFINTKGDAKKFRDGSACGCSGCLNLENIDIDIFGGEEIGSVISQLGWPYNQGFHCNSNVIISTNVEVLQYVQKVTLTYMYISYSIKHIFKY